MINLIEIQESLFFENDGEIDLLTGAMSPNRFNQIVKRDVEIAERNGGSLAIISLKLDLENLLSAEIKDCSMNLKQRSNSIIKSEIESLLVEVNFNLKSILRGSDCISRVSQTGFWIFINAATPDGLQLLKNRIKDLIPTNISIEIIPRDKNQNQLSWYQNIDLKHFK